MTTTRVDFYVLPGQSQPERFACVLAGKAWQQGNMTCLHTTSRESAEILDDLLWTFRDISFIPHTLQDDTGDTKSPVLIGWEDQYPDNAGVLINLTPEIPEFAGRFSRIVEIVAGDEIDRQRARDRFRAYRERGYDMHDHKLDSDHVPS